jgi:NADH-quinone oxidoreductase subunit E
MRHRENVMADERTNLARVDEIIEEYGGGQSVLIQVLLDVQKEYHWLSGECLAHVSERLKVPPPKVYQVATFYKAFSLVPRGRHTISVCLGTACHVRNAPMLLGRICQKLALQPGKTTKDNRFTLLTVNCMGCCALGPVISIDDTYYSNPSYPQFDKIFEKYK